MQKNKRSPRPRHDGAKPLQGKRGAHYILGMMESPDFKELCLKVAGNYLPGHVRGSVEDLRVVLENTIKTGTELYIRYIWYSDRGQLWIESIDYGSLPKVDDEEYDDLYKMPF
jgi:hypothetical protein